MDSVVRIHVMLLHLMQPRLGSHPPGTVGGFAPENRRKSPNGAGRTAERQSPNTRLRYWLLITHLGSTRSRMARKSS